MTAEAWIEKYSGWPEGDEKFAESISELVSQDEELNELANTYLEALETFRNELRDMGFEPG